MNLISLIFIAFGAAFAMIWLISYLPIYSTFLGKVYSPRLLICKILAPFDVAMTTILVCGSWVGCSTAATGIGMIIYNVMTGIGLSLGVQITRKWFVPKWKERFEKRIKEGNNGL